MNYEIWPLVSTAFLAGGAAAAGWKTYTGVIHETLSGVLTQLAQKVSSR